MLSTQVLALLGVVGLVVAAPPGQAPPPGGIDCPHTICIDGINPECGIRWGDCYDYCKPSLKPTMPPCKPSSTKTTATRTPKPILTLPTKPPKTTLRPTTRTPPSSTTDNCSTRTVCIDYVNECGQWYGGCHADCRPWPTYSKPPCLTSSTVDTPRAT